MPAVNMTVGEIASHVPAALRIFEKFNIDYSCCGTKSLARACRDLGVRAEAVLSEIEDAQSGEVEEQLDWTEASLSDLIDHIVRQHHWYAWAELPRLEHLMAKLLQSYHPEYPECLLLLSGVFRGLRGELEQHMTKEQTQIFPSIAMLERSTPGNLQLPVTSLNLLDRAIAALLHEHELSGQALKEIREVTHHFTAPENCGGTHQALMRDLEQFEEDLHIHIHLESNILFPRARKLIESYS